MWRLPPQEMELKRLHSTWSSLLWCQSCQRTQQMQDQDHYTKTLGIQWNAQKDHYRLTILKAAILSLRGYHQTHVSVRYRKDVWCPRLFLTLNNQSEDPPKATVGVESRLGWSSTTNHMWCMVALAIWAPPTCREAYSKVLLQKRFYCYFHWVLQILRCFWVTLRC